MPLCAGLAVTAAKEIACCWMTAKKHGIYCNYFLKAVLPAEKELYAEILRQNGMG